MEGIKTGGRKKGTPNRVTKVLRVTLRDLIAAELDAIPQTLEGLQPKERLELVIKLLPFCLPKIQSIGGKYDAVLGDWD